MYSERTTEKTNVTHLIFDIAWFGLALAATSRFMSIFAIRLGATSDELSLLAALPGIALFLSTGLSSWWRRRFPDTLRAILLPSLAFRLVFLLPAFTPFFPPEWQMTWLILAMAMSALPQGVAGAMFLLLMRESVSQKLQTSLASRRTLAMNVTVAIGAIAFGIMLEKVPFPINYQIMFTLAFLFALVSFRHVLYVRVIYPEPPHDPGHSTTAIWRSHDFLAVAFVAAIAHITFFAVIMATPLRLVEDLGASEGFMAMFGMAELFAGAMAAMATERLVRRLGLRLFMALAIGGTALAAMIIGLSPILELTLLAALISGATWTAATIGIYVFLVERVPQSEATSSSVAYQQIIALSVFAGPLLGGLLMNHISSLVTIMLIGALLRLLAGVFTYYNAVDVAMDVMRATQPMQAITDPSHTLDGDGRREGWSGRWRLSRVRVGSSRRRR